MATDPAGGPDGAEREVELRSMGPTRHRRTSHVVVGTVRLPRGRNMSGAGDDEKDYDVTGPVHIPKDPTKRADLYGAPGHPHCAACCYGTLIAASSMEEFET